MALKHIYGNGDEGIQAIHIPDDDDSTVTFGPFNIADFDLMGIQLIGINEGFEFPVNVGEVDNVVASTKTWTLANSNLTAANEGMSLVVSGTASNDGTYVIDTVLDLHSFTTVGSPGGDETFTASALFWVQDTSVTALAGTWAVQVSNDFTPAASGLQYSQDSGFRGTWTDITSAIDPSLITQTSGPGTDPVTQFIVMDLPFRSLRFQFAPTTDTGGTAKVACTFKSRS